MKRGRRGNSRRREVQPGRFRPLVWAVAAAAGLAAGVLGGAGRISALTPLLPRLAAVSVAGARRVDVASRIAQAGLVSGSLLDPRTLAGLRDSLLADPWVRRADVAALPTGRLLVRVDERRPVARALLGKPLRAYWVDAQGRPFAAAPAQARLPLLEGVPDARPGAADATLRQGVEILKALGRYGLPTPSAVVLGGGDPAALPALWLPLAGGQTCHVILGGAHLDARLDRLARLLAAELPETLSAAEIDLRFGAQVVLRSAASPGSQAPQSAARGGAAASARGDGSKPETGRAG